MRRTKDTGTVLAPLAVGAVAIVCCAGLPAIAAVFAASSLVARLYPLGSSQKRVTRPATAYGSAPAEYAR